jgi:hypothetical protein
VVLSPVWQKIRKWIHLRLANCEIQLWEHELHELKSLTSAPVLPLSE